MTRAIIIMGVSGSGKTTVGTELAQTLTWPFYDADDFHPKANIDKMASAQPLNDDDRQPWLEALQRLIRQEQAQGQSLVLACSALKARYRQTLAHNNSVNFVFLKGSFDTIYSWMQAREGHYMQAEMLKSQFEALEEPRDALVIDIDQHFAQSVDDIVKAFNLLSE